MNNNLQNCLSITNGALFYRGDLHIHSYGASHDVRDIGMTPEAIVDTAKRENLRIIAVADHNEISNVQATVNAGITEGILVIPAVELSTPEGHLLCYFPTVDILAQFHGRLSLADRNQSTSRCSTDMLACLELTKGLGGFAILAHIDAGNGLETKFPGGSLHKTDILCHPALLGIELSRAASDVRYSPDDPESVRAHIGAQRIERLALGERQYLSRILNSDSHTLIALGRNALNAQKLTRYKMGVPTFEGLKLALEEGDSRIRLEDEIPTTTPFILGAAIEGGYLTGQSIHFSKNLNCIIGGRGTGKSTTFEALRCLTGSDSGVEVVDSEVWPHLLNLFWQDEAGQKHSLSRAIGDKLINQDNQTDGPISFELDCFGQGEAARVREHAKNDPLALMKYLDTFTRVQEALKVEKNARDELKVLHKSIVEAEAKVGLIPQVQRSLAVVKQQLKTFEDANGSEVIKLQRNIATEKAKKENITNRLTELKAIVLNPSISTHTATLRSIVDGNDIVNGREEAVEIVSAVNEFTAKINIATLAINDAFTHLQANISASMSRWSAKEKPIQEIIQQKRQALEALGIMLDMAHVAKLTAEETRLQQDLTNLQTWEPHLKGLKIQYGSKLSTRWQSRRDVANLRVVYAFKASKALAEVLSDLQVKLQYVDSGYSQEAASIIQEAMSWRTVNHSKARNIIENIPLPELLESILKSKISLITSIKVDDGVQLFNEAEAKAIVQRLNEPLILAALEQCHIDDLPKLTVTRRLDVGGGKPNIVQRDFSQLSLGQQQSVLLALILSSDSKRPLIIDQPEDNLDSEFIFHTFVPVLRRAKERRQVIIVTHNANIAVLGDAEQLIVFKSNSSHSKIVARGSIDESDARDNACKILEGAREAFTRRARVYGIKL